MNDDIQGFEKLRVWQESRTLVKDIYIVTREFPREELFGLTNQVRRAAVSISSNISEGAARTSPKDQKHFFTMAFGSVYEVLNQLILSNDLGFINDETLKKFRRQTKTICSQLAKLSASTTKRIN